MKVESEAEAEVMKLTAKKAAILKISLMQSHEEVGMRNSLRSVFSEMKLLCEAKTV